jgi:hypothetical protein
VWSQPSGALLLFAFISQILPIYFTSIPINGAMLEVNDDKNPETTVSVPRTRRIKASSASAVMNSFITNPF